ncbi:MAG: PhzF family phenazine biosynthesis protein [Bacteroidota bacterium]
MPRLSFFLLNIFAETAYSGNQLAVIQSDEPLEESTMLAIARETQYKETAFILPKIADAASYPVRIFTALGELPYAGHAVLGTAFIIQQVIENEPSKEVSIALPVGQVTLHSESDSRMWMRQLPPEFGEELPSEVISPVLNLPVNAFHRNYPVQVVSTGLPFIIVPLVHLDAVRQSRVNRLKYLELINETNAKALYIFCAQPYRPENDLNARMFGEYFGVPEDPATGSASGCLAGYLLHHNFFKLTEFEVRLEQGYEIKRPSLLFLKGKKESSTYSVEVGGNIQMVAKGEWVG